MASPQLKAVIFDLDGILVDTARFHTDAWARLARSVGATPPADLDQRVRGVSRMESLKIALGSSADQFTGEQLEEMAARKNEVYKDAIQALTPDDIYPGALELFRDLKDNGIAIALGSASKNARAVLDQLQITDWFDAISDGHRHTRGKPDPEVFEVAADMLGVQPSECIVIEDAEAGIDAAIAGGFVAVGMGDPVALCCANLLVESLTELSAWELKHLHAECFGR